MKTDMIRLSSAFCCTNLTEGKSIHECYPSGMRPLRPGTRGTSVAQPLSRLRKTFAGPLRPGTRQSDFDEGVARVETRRSLALSRSASGRRRREYRLFRGRLDAAAA